MKLNELTNNNSEIITISFQDKSNDNDLIFITGGEYSNDLKISGIEFSNNIKIFEGFYLGGQKWKGSEYDKYGNITNKIIKGLKTF